MADYPGQERLESMLQDCGETCGEIRAAFNNREVVYNDDTATDWDKLTDRLSSIIDEMTVLRATAARDPDAKVDLPYVPLFGVTNGRGRIIL